MNLDRQSAGENEQLALEAEQYGDDGAVVFALLAISARMATIEQAILAVSNLKQSP